MPSIDLRTSGITRAVRLPSSSSSVADPAALQSAAWNASSWASSAERSPRPAACSMPASSARSSRCGGVVERDGRTRQRLALDEDAHGGDVVELGRTGIAHPCAASGQPLDPALLRQPRQRVADGDRADAQLLCDRALDDARARGESARADRVTQVRGGIRGDPRLADPAVPHSSMIYQSGRPASHAAPRA